MNQTDPTAVIARIRQMADYWEQHLPEVIRTPAVVAALRAALEPAAASAVVSPPPSRAELRDRIRRAICEAEGFAWDTDMLEPDEYGDVADAVLAVLPVQDDRAAVLLEAADAGEDVANRIHASGDDHRASGAYDVVDELRRLAVEAQDAATAEHRTVDGTRYLCHTDDHYCPDAEARPAGTQQPETETRPARGDQFEAWLKTQRDAAADYPEAYSVADGLLDLYRLHADTGTPLGEHVCERRLAGDCECLEPAPVAQQPAAADDEETRVHACPEPGENGISSCCGRPPCEFVGEHVTRDPDKVTCRGPRP